MVVRVISGERINAANHLQSLGFKKEVIRVVYQSRQGNLLEDRTISRSDYELVVSMAASQGNKTALEAKGITSSPRCKSRKTEKTVQVKLAEQLDGVLEVCCVSGEIDILTAAEIIEIKKVKNWKSALGQVLVYGMYYPSHQKRIHLFGETQTSFLGMIIEHCGKLDVIVTWER